MKLEKCGPDDVRELNDRIVMGICFIYDGNEWATVKYQWCRGFSLSSGSVHGSGGTSFVMSVWLISGRYSESWSNVLQMSSRWDTGHVIIAWRLRSWVPRQTYANELSSSESSARKLKRRYGVLGSGVSILTPQAQVPVRAAACSE